MKDVVVVGGGLAGLSATMKLAEQGYKVKLVSVTHVRRSHSVCAQGGINIAVNLKGEGDSPIIHAYDTVKGGDFLADQPPIVEMCMAGPAILRMLDRFGCPFNRTPEGTIDFRRFGGTLYNRTAFCGASTGQQLLYALDEQVRRYESKQLVEKFEHHEFLRLVRDDEGNARGIVVHNLHNLDLEVIKGDAVVLATGGLGFLYRKSTNSTFCTGAANARAYIEGMHYANGEFIQIHPTAIPGKDKCRLLTETLRGSGSRVWVYGDSSKTMMFPDGSEHPCGKTGEPWYFLEEMYPAYGNTVPRDIGAREILRVCEHGLGVDGKNQVYLDATALPLDTQQKLDAALDIYEKFMGKDPRKVPMKIYPAVHYTMGGGWVDWPAADDPDRDKRYRQMTNIKGLFNIGESDFSYHGANRLGGNSLLSCIYSGLVCGGEIPNYLDHVSKSYQDLPASIFTKDLQKELDEQKDLFAKKGSENVHALADELAEELVKHVTVKRDNRELQKTLDFIKQIKERFANIGLDDKGKSLNQTYVFAKQFGPMIELAMVITKGALLRNEFRGAHFKPEFPHRDDVNWLKTTIAKYNPSSDEPEISYKPVDTRHFKPVKREYTTAKKVIPEIHNMPDNIELPV
jgi:succinate dehydrogenase / fumarate reductase, flavoprotein subunit